MKIYKHELRNFLVATFFLLAVSGFVVLCAYIEEIK